MFLSNGLIQRLLVTLFLFLIIGKAHAQDTRVEDPVLTIDSGTKKIVYKRSELLGRKDLRSISIAKDPSFPGRVMNYKAVPVPALFEGVKFADDAVIQFRCTDGFSAPISKDRLLNTDPARSHAYVAIEDPTAPWPPVKPGGPVAGPFYLVWPDAELSQVMQEEWPFQLAAFEVKGSLESLYPQIFPDKKLPPNHLVRRGMDVFVKNCFPCHTMNKAGASQVGPDLNVPFGPTEYFSGPFLRRLIRDNQSVRYYPDGKMSAFPPELLPEKDLDALLTYLEHMTKRKLPEARAPKAP